MVAFIDVLYIHLGTTGNTTPPLFPHSLQFTVTQALWFSGFTSRILVTDLSQPHCNFKSHMKSSLHRLIHVLPLFCNCQFRRIDSVQFLSSQAHTPAGGVLQLDSIRRAEQSRAVAYCRQPASTVTPGIEPRWDPWLCICSVSRLLFFSFFLCSSFDKKGGVGLFS
jgi:hypothetical protein